MRSIARNIPNFITCLNLLCGCLAIMMSFRSTELIALDWHGWQWAIIFILAATVFDFMDGFAARGLHAYSDLGKELDSLSDLVSFGVAPAFLLFNTLNSFHPQHENVLGIHYLVFLIPLFGAWRLARFNVRDAGGDNSVFRGLPIPANALFWIGYTDWIWNYGTPDDHVVALAILLISISMVSNLTLPSLKFKTYGLSGNKNRYIILITTVTLLCLFHLKGLVWAIFIYIVMGVFTRQPANAESKQ